MSNSVFKFLNEDKSSCEFKGKVFDVSISLETNEKYFTYENNKDYFIIENEKQTIARMLKDGKEINFKRCIFIYKDTRFLVNTKKDILFNNSVFCEDVAFDACKFPSMIFLRTLFEKELRSFGGRFKGILVFDFSIFMNEVNFSYCEFYSNFQAIGIYSEKNFSFTNNKFEKGLSLNASHFKEKLLFNSDRDFIIKGHVSFYKAIIKYIFFNDINTGKDFSITFFCAKIEDIDYTGTNFTNVKDRETFLILKEIAIKKSDHINALNFYKSEMFIHTKKLEKKKELDYWILKFEEVVSDFGTNPIKPILYIIYISFVFSLFVSFFTDSWNVYFENSLLLMNPTLSVKDILEISLNKTNNITIPPLIEVFNFLKSIIHGILIYETIKSFRKFSRKL